MIEVTEQDVLRGAKTIAVERRNGAVETVKCRALSWPASCQVMSSSEIAQGMIHTLLNGVPKEQANDAFLNELTPESLNIVSGVILQLTNGFPGLKKAQAAGKANAPASPISSPPPENCASTDSAEPKPKP